MIAVIPVIVYAAAAILLLALGDNLGVRIACMAAKRCRRYPLLYLPRWMQIPVGILVPCVILAGAAGGVVFRWSSAEAAVGGLESILLVTFFVVGALGGFLAHRGDS